LQRAFARAAKTAEQQSQAEQARGFACVDHGGQSPTVHPVRKVFHGSTFSGWLYDLPGQIEHEGSGAVQGDSLQDRKAMKSMRSLLPVLICKFTSVEEKGAQTVQRGTLMKRMNRRTFLKHTSLAAGAVTALAPPARALGANDELKANQLVTREYRAPFVVPENV
jgi:hypothetical protein